MKRSRLESLLEKFDAEFDTSYEDQANRVRGEFVETFPLQRLPKLTIDRYVIGTKEPTFCAFVEPRTRLWANIIAATALKFGVYYGHTRHPHDRYRFAHKYGASANEAFGTVKSALLDLVDSGRSLRFRDIDENILSPLFKAKILSLYFPDKYLNVCSPDHITEMAAALELPSVDFVSERQAQLLKAARNDPMTRTGAIPK